MSDGHWPPQLSYWIEIVCRLISLFLLFFFMCNFVVVATTKQQQQKDWVIGNWTEMYVYWSFCSCCGFSCVILLLLQHQNYTVTSKTTIRTKQQPKNSVIDNWTENVCTLIFLFLLLFFSKCNFVVVETTKLLSNNNKNNNNYKNKIVLLIIEQKMYVGWSFFLVVVLFNV